MNRQRLEQQLYAFVSQAINRLDDGTPWARGMLAKLRRASGKDLAESPDVWEASLSGLPEELCGRGEGPSPAERMIHTALTFYALHKQGKDDSMHDPESKLSFGGAAAKLRTESNEAGIRRRFDSVITAADITELAQHARGLIQQMRASDMPIKMNYAKFAEDLFFYQDPNRRDSVCLAWGEDFHRSVNQKEEDDNNEQ